MNHDVLRNPEFWTQARGVAEAPHGHGGVVLADWLDEHDSPLRAHIFRHGVPEHLIDRERDAYGDAVPARPGVILKDEGKHVRPLRGVWSGEHRNEHANPIAAHHDGRETYELFTAEPTVPSADPRFVVRYTLRIPGDHHVRLVAPAGPEHLRALGDAQDVATHVYPEPTQIAFNHWHAFADRLAHPAYEGVERAVPLARVKVAPGTPYGQPFGGGSAIVSHDVHDEAGKRLGVVRVQERNDGNMLHVHWTEGQFGPEGVRGVMDGLAHHYPNAEFVSGYRGHGTEGQTGFRRPSQRTLVVKPLRPAKLARVQAAPGGNPTIVNNMAYRPGQFIAKARQRIRDVAAKLVKLAREPAPFEADTSARGLFGRSPHDEAEERPLTLGELKGIETEHKLPEHHLLSPHVYQSPDVKGDEHPYTASNEDIRWFIHNVSRAALPEPRVRALLASRDLPTGAKLTHLLANMKADYDAAHKGADGSGGSWYEGQINEMEKHLHSAAAGGKDHPLWGSMGKDGQLVGKHAPEENHPGVVLFKALLAATSGAQNPMDNTLSAARAWAAGRRRGHPILDMPTYNEDSKEEWLNKARRLNRITPTDYEREAHLRNPGTTQEQRARWYNTFVKPHAGELDSEMDGKPVGYAASEARINPDHTVVWEQDGGGNKVRHGGKDERGTSFAAKLPLVHPDGSLKTKGWGARGDQAASGISSLKALFHVAKAENPQATEAEQFRWVARWLLHDHDAKDFAHVQDTLKRLGVNLPDLGANTFDYKKHGQQGWFDKGERVPGMFVLGPKFGAFGMNLNSNSPHVAAKYRRFLTADMWFSRNWARYLGQMFRGRKRKPTETPTANDRRQMAVAIHKLCTDLGVHPADLQADLWYHEQSLYRMLGQDAKRTVSVSYADAARKWLDKNSPHALRDRDGKLIRLAKRKPKPIQHTWETVPHTDPELQTWTSQLTTNHGGPVDHTNAKVFADWLEEHNDWRHHLMRKTADPSPLFPGNRAPFANGIFHGGPANWRDAYSNASKMSDGNIAVETRRLHPERPGDTIYSKLTPEEYEAMRRDAATAGVHFPKVTA